MKINIIGEITKITGAKILIKVRVADVIKKLDVNNFCTNYISVGSIIGTRLVDGRTLVMAVEEIYDKGEGPVVVADINGVFDETTGKFSFGTNKYPLVGEMVFKVERTVLKSMFSRSKGASLDSIGSYIYDADVEVEFDPNILFGKHLGVFGNTGSGKTCTVVSIMQNYIRNNPSKDIKFIILDVNGEYKHAFEESEAEFISFDNLRLHHSILSNPEYGRLFRAAESVQYPALRDSISELAKIDTKWDLNDLPQQIEKWVQAGSKGNNYTYGQLSNFVRTMNLRIDGILNDRELMDVINSADDKNTIEAIISTPKKVVILDLQVSMDTLDIIVYMLFKAVYLSKSLNRGGTHLTMVLEEAHRYINSNSDDSRLGAYYIDKLAREGRKFGIGLIIASQIPSMLAYEVISQCNSVVMHKITNRRDMDYLKGVLRISNDLLLLQMSALERQCAIVCGEAFPMDTVVKVKEASPLPLSEDPIIM